MNKEEILTILQKYNFNVNEYVVISGAAMVLYGIKNITGDIDISVTDNLYNYLLNNYNCIFERTNEFGEKVYFIDDIINFSRTYYTNKKKYIDNIPVQSIDELIKLKEYLNRDKDKQDIERIRKYKGDLN